MFKILSTIFLSIILIRLVFRKKFDLPGYKGKSLLYDAGIVDVMPEAQFWALIKSTRDNSKREYGLQCWMLTKKLETLTPAEIIAFDRTFVALMAKSYNYRLWAAAYALNGGCSDDCFEYFRSWLIAQGRNNFYWINRFPRLLLLIGVKEVIEHYEGVAYCAFDAYHNKTGNEIPRPSDIKYNDAGHYFSGTGSFLRYPELALLAW